MLKNILFFGFILIVSSACEKKETLVWEDNFDGTSLNESFWNFELGDGCPNLCGWGNNERQIYTRDNHVVKDGFLTITARKEDSLYTSTRITTNDKFELTYGRFVMYAKIPGGKGIWPAFWMLGSNINEVGWPKCGEIDIMEYVGKDPGVLYTTLHTQDSHGNSINSKKSYIENIEEGFHLFEVDWKPESITFFIDGKEVYQFAPSEKNEDNWPFHQPFYLLVNMAIGGNFGGPEVDDGIFPREYIIDYIRVYKN
ncbi:MAG: glycoside hydrolase family 16 protein [Flavobacteriaceae bacterium]